MDKAKPGNKMNFAITWKVIVFAVVAFLAIRVALRLLENFLQLGMADMTQAVLTGVLGTLATFVFARKKTGES